MQSVHKILSGLSQAAVLHVDTAMLDPAVVRRALQLTQTTSPHFAIMASIDLARRQMMIDGRALLDETLERARRAAGRLGAIGGVRVLRPEHLAGAGTGLHQLDETKLLIGTNGLAADARDIVARLNGVHGVQPELSGAGHVLCITTIGNTDGDIGSARRRHDGSGRLCRAPWRTGAGGPHDRRSARRAPRVDPHPREAFFAADVDIPLSQAAGRVAAEPITPYPPGIPLVMPGERLDPEVVSLLRSLRANGNPISASDPFA